MYLQYHTWKSDGKQLFRIAGWWWILILLIWIFRIEITEVVICLSENIAFFFFWIGLPLCRQCLQNSAEFLIVRVLQDQCPGDCWIECTAFKTKTQMYFIPGDQVLGYFRNGQTKYYWQIIQSHIKMRVPGIFVVKDRTAFQADSSLKGFRSHA